MNQLQIFNNKDFGELKSLIINDDPWFFGSSIAEILGYSNTKDALIRHVDEDGKKIIQRSQFATLEIPNRGLTVINESGLYSLILGSKLPNAKKFKRWVTSEVLPSIRKHGMYEVPKDPMDALKLMFEAQTTTNERVTNIETDVRDLKDNKLLNPGEYNYLNAQVRKRVRTIKEVRKLELSKKQNSKLFSFINRDLNNYIGIRTRSQFKQNDFEKALQFISEWDLGYTDLKIIEDIVE